MKTEETTSALKILVIGANGGIGKNVVQLALEAGHHVTAVLRNPANLTLKHTNLEIVQGDILEPERLGQYFKNKDAVISALGVKGGFWSDKPTTLYSRGSANILRAMGKRDTNRVFFISASAIEISPVIPFFIRLIAKYIVQKLLRNMYDDLRRMEKLVKESNVNWTIIRPPRLTNKPVTGHYRVAINRFLKNCFSISRADLAHFMLNNVTNQATYKATIEIAY
jgi:putative NADH-flavin reductase